MENERRRLVSSIIITHAFFPALLCAFISCCFFFRSTPKTVPHVYFSPLCRSPAGGITLRTAELFLEAELGPCTAGSAFSSGKNAEAHGADMDLTL